MNSFCCQITFSAWILLEKVSYNKFHKLENVICLKMWKMLLFIYWNIGLIVFIFHIWPSSWVSGLAYQSPYFCRYAIYYLQSSPDKYTYLPQTHRIKGNLNSIQVWLMNTLSFSLRFGQRMISQTVLLIK